VSIPEVPDDRPPQHAHQLIDRLPEAQLSTVVGLLQTIVDPVAAALSNAPMDDELETEEEKRARPKPVSGSSGTAARAFRMRKPCGGWGWGEGDRVDRDGARRHGHAR